MKQRISANGRMDNWMNARLANVIGIVPQIMMYQNTDWANDTQMEENGERQRKMKK
jgi:hypothetical protein